MLIEIGQVEAIFRYPVKSMAGQRLEVANLGWHGLEGDRRLAFRRMRIDDRSGFPCGYQQASFPTCSGLLRSVVKAMLVKTLIKRTFLRIFARRMAKRCLS